jgi:NAD(P)-dependent dehydrogenase (short-subunit alcohol dehydrogenase family)
MTTLSQPSLAGTVAMVTGGARGIGAAAARAFADAGAAVAVCDVLDDSARETVAQLNETGARAMYVRTDVSSAGDVASSVEHIIDEFGRLDFAHNNAGTFSPAPLGDLDDEEWRRVIDVNLTGVFLCMKHQLPQLIKTRGAIVNTASIWATTGAAGQAAYSASKHGVVGLTKSAARDYGPVGVRVNAVAPGPIETAMTAAVPDDVMDTIIARTAQLRTGRPAEIGDAVVWLCSRAASYINGVVLPIDGGWLAG